jgi:hypothetical protein
VLRLHPLLHLVVQQPQLLVDHAAGYAEVAMAEAARAAAQWERRVAWQLAASTSLVMALLLAGVGVMLWAALPPGSIARPGLLASVPLLPLMLALVAQFRARRAGSHPAFELLRRQAASDLMLLRDASVGVRT